MARFVQYILRIIPIAALALTVFVIFALLFGIPTFKPNPQEVTYDQFIRERLVEAEIIFLKAKKARHEAAKETPIPHDNPWSPANFRNIWDYFYPNYNCPHSIERLGRVGDGGKWVCGIQHIHKHSEYCVIYSYGINLETSFEEDLLARTKCVIRAFDHTVKSEDMLPVVKKYHPRLKFTSTGIGFERSETLRTLAQDMEKFGDGFIDILKIDVEGAEFEVLTKILKDFPQALPFGQLLVELHVDELPLEGRFRYLFTWWEKLEKAGLRAYRSEPNLFPALFGHGNQQSYFEFSFLNVKSDHLLLHG